MSYSEIDTTKFQPNLTPREGRCEFENENAHLIRGSNLQLHRSFEIPFLFISGIFEKSNDSVFIIFPSDIIAEKVFDIVQHLNVSPFQDAFKILTLDDNVQDLNRYKIIFTTSDYMLNSKHIVTAKTVIITDAHIPSVSLSLVKTVLKWRIGCGDVFRLLVTTDVTMSQTEMSFWDNQLTLIEPHIYSCLAEVIEEDITADDAVERLIFEHSCKEIVVYLEQLSSMDDVAEHIEHRLSAHEDILYEIYDIGDVDSELYRFNVKPELDVTVVRIYLVVGNPAIIHLSPWVDGCVGSQIPEGLHGYTFIKHPTRTDTPYSPHTSRAVTAEDLIFLCAKLELKHADLMSMINGDISEASLRLAEISLRSCGLVNSVPYRSNDTEECFDILKMPKDIEAIYRFDVDFESYRTLAALAFAEMLDVLPEALPFIALLECPDIKKNIDRSVDTDGQDFYDSSDLINTSITALNALYYENVHWINQNQQTNIDYNKLNTYKSVLEDLIVLCDMKDVTVEDFIVPMSQLSNFMLSDPTVVTKLKAVIARSCFYSIVSNDLDTYLFCSTEDSQKVSESSVLNNVTDRDRQASDYIRNTHNDADFKGRVGHILSKADLVQPFDKGSDITISSDLPNTKEETSVSVPDMTKTPHVWNSDVKNAPPNTVLEVAYKLQSALARYVPSHNAKKRGEWITTSGIVLTGVWRWRYPVDK